MNLIRRSNSEDLLLVDTRPFTEYSKGHIQGAVNIDLFQFHCSTHQRLVLNGSKTKAGFCCQT